jgi:microcystin-dependent protein
MKIKIEMDLPRWLSRAILVAVPVVIVAIGAWVFAGVPNTFTAGQTVSAQKLNDNFAAVATPPGTVVAFAGTNLPSGWLLCDGSAVNRTTYAGLFGAIGIAHGGGDGVATFNLPDYRGRFLRGVDGAAGRDPDSANRAAPQTGVAIVTGGPGNTGNSVGSVQGDALASHTHNAVHTHGAYAAAGNQFTAISDIDGDTLTTYIPTQPFGGSETRPRNVAVTFIIKY